MEAMNLRIKELCSLKGITLTELSERSGIARETLSREGNPTLKTLTVIASALDVQVAELFLESKQITGAVRIGDNVRLIDSVQDIEMLLEELKGS